MARYISLLCAIFVTVLLSRPLLADEQEASWGQIKALVQAEPAGKLVVSSDKVSGSHDRLPPNAYWGFEIEDNAYYAVYQDSVHQIVDGGGYQLPAFVVCLDRDARAGEFAISVTVSEPPVSSFVVSGIPGRHYQILEVFEPRHWAENIFFPRWEGDIVVSTHNGAVFAVFHLEAGGHVKAVAMGDIDGNGRQNILDVFMVSNRLIDSIPLESWQFVVADLDHNGEIQLIDAHNLIRLIEGRSFLRLGDVSMDGTVTAFDARAISLYVRDGTGFDRWQKAAADVNQDGGVTQEDADMVMDIMIGKIQHPQGSFGH